MKQVQKYYTMCSIAIVILLNQNKTNQKKIIFGQFVYPPHSFHFFLNTNINDHRTIWQGLIITMHCKFINWNLVKLLVVLIKTLANMNEILIA